MSAVEVVAEEDIDKDEAVNQYLTFIMDKEEYGVDILSVKEIRIWDSATPIPKAPSHVRGVINLRGSIVPIIDLRQCFGMDAIEYGPLTVVLVLQVDTEKGHREVGVVVDAVSDVYTLEQSQVKPAPDLGGKTQTEYIKGLASIDDKMVILLNMSILLDQDDFADIAEAQKELLEAAHKDTVE